VPLQVKLTLRRIILRTNRWLVLVAATLTWLLAGCAAVPQQDAVKEVHACVAGNCDDTGRKFSADELRVAIAKFLKDNEGETIPVCSADPKTRACESDGICHFVLGGGIPGLGCAQNVVFSGVAIGQQAGQIDLKTAMPRTFVGIPMTCADMTGSLTVRSANEIFVDFQPSYCNWLGVGNMTATFTFAVDSLDLDHGQIGAYWSHAVVGNGIGRGSGYLVFKFPKSASQGGKLTQGQRATP
jgi:hypothetical protein